MTITIHGNQEIITAINNAASVMDEKNPRTQYLRLAVLPEHVLTIAGGSPFQAAIYNLLDIDFDGELAENFVFYLPKIKLPKMRREMTIVTDGTKTEITIDGVTMIYSTAGVSVFDFSKVYPKPDELAQYTTIRFNAALLIAAIKSAGTDHNKTVYIDIPINQPVKPAIIRGSHSAALALPVRMGY